MSQERRGKKKQGGGEGLSPELREILEKAAINGEVNAGLDAAIEENLIITRDEILKMHKSMRGSRKRKKSSD